VASSSCQTRVRFWVHISHTCVMAKFGTPWARTPRATQLEFGVSFEDLTQWVKSMTLLKRAGASIPRSHSRYALLSPLHLKVENPAAGFGSLRRADSDFFLVKIHASWGQGRRLRGTAVWGKGNSSSSFSKVLKIFKTVRFLHSSNCCWTCDCRYAVQISSVLLLN
jgi:hypothetical protein